MLRAMHTDDPEWEQTLAPDGRLLDSLRHWIIAERRRRWQYASLFASNPDQRVVTLTLDAAGYHLSIGAHGDLPGIAPLYLHAGRLASAKVEAQAAFRALIAGRFDAWRAAGQPPDDRQHRHSTVVKRRGRK